MANNKIIYGGEVLIDLTADTVTPETLAKNMTAHDKTGAIIVGTSTKDSDTSDATIAVAEMLDGKTAYARGSKLEGTMPNNGAVSGVISSKSETYRVPIGYHDGSGYVGISEVDQEKLIADNIREGITILGVEGIMSGSEDEKPQTLDKIVPSKVEQVFTPSEGYTCFTEFTVGAIPYTESPNAAGGTTVTIA